MLYTALYVSLVLHYLYVNFYFCKLRYYMYIMYNFHIGRWSNLVFTRVVFLFWPLLPTTTTRFSRLLEWNNILLKALKEHLYEMEKIVIFSSNIFIWRMLINNLYDHFWSWYIDDTSLTCFWWGVELFLEG